MPKLYLSQDRSQLSQMMQKKHSYFNPYYAFDRPSRSSVRQSQKPFVVPPVSKTKDEEDPKSAFITCRKSLQILSKLQIRSTNVVEKRNMTTVLSFHGLRNTARNIYSKCQIGQCSQNQNRKWHTQTDQ